MQPSSGKGTQEIEDQIFHMAQSVFDIVAKNPDEQHVAAQMPNIGMQKCACQRRQHIKAVGNNLVDLRQAAQII